VNGIAIIGINNIKLNINDLAANIMHQPDDSWHNCHRANYKRYGNSLYQRTLIAISSFEKALHPHLSDTALK
jgi:hypothetical protein